MSAEELKAELDALLQQQSDLSWKLADLSELISEKRRELADARRRAGCERRHHQSGRRANMSDKTPAESITIQEAWEAAGGNPGIKATKAELLESLRTLDKVCDEADATPTPPAAPDDVSWLVTNGWRRCAVGQGTSQFCEQAERLAAERDETLALLRNLVFAMRERHYGAMPHEAQAAYDAALARAKEQPD